MKTPAKRGRGRPPISGETGQRYQVTIPPSVADRLRRFGKGSLSGGINSDPRVVHLEYLKTTIRLNQKQIELLESGNMTVGSGPQLGNASTAAVEAVRLRKKNEELQSLVRQEEAWQRRQKAFFALHRQFLPHGNGQPSAESIAEFDAAEKEWRAVQQEVERIVDEIRAGLR